LLSYAQNRKPCGAMSMNMFGAAADVLAVAAMALRLEVRFAPCHVANFLAIIPPLGFSEVV